MLRVTKGLPFCFEYNLSNDVLLDELMTLSNGKTIKVFTSIDSFDLVVTDEHGLEIDVKRLNLEDKMISICY